MQGRQNPHKTKGQKRYKQKSYGSEFTVNVKDSKM